MGAAARMELAPLSASEARWLKRHIRSMDRLTGRYARKHNAHAEPTVLAMHQRYDAGRRALQRYSERPWTQRWSKPRKPLHGETTLQTWLAHLKAESLSELAVLESLAREEELRGATQARSQTAGEPARRDLPSWSPRSAH